MKKMFLTVLTVVLFSVSGWANIFNVSINNYETSELSKFNFTNFEIIDYNILDDIKCRDCFAEATIIEVFVTHYEPYADAYSVFAGYYDWCSASGNCCNCLNEVVVTP